MTNALLLLAQVTKRLGVNQKVYNILRRIYSSELDNETEYYYSIL